MKKEKNLKNKIVIVVSMIVALVLCVVLILMQKEKLRIASLSSENQRAMNYEQFSDGDEKVEGTNNVEFSAFFLRDLDGDGYAEKIKGTCKEIGKQDTMYMEINVLSEGYLKDAKIEIQGNNFYFNTTLPKDSELKKNYIGANVTEIEFNQLNNGTQKILMGFVRSGDYSTNYSKTDALGRNINNYSRDDNKVVLTGKYYDEEENEVDIRKEITLNMDWYGTTKAEVSATEQELISSDEIINEETEIYSLHFGIEVHEKKNELFLSKNVTEAEIPTINGYKPISVRIEDSNVENCYSYDENTCKLTITEETGPDEAGYVNSNIHEFYIGYDRCNDYKVIAEYPIEAYRAFGSDTFTVKIPVTTYFEGINNPNREFINPYKSNVAKDVIAVGVQKPEGTVALVDVDVGYYRSEPVYRYMISKAKPIKIYNQLTEREINDVYPVVWRISTGEDGDSSGVILKETTNGSEQETDRFIKNNASEESMEELTTNIGVYFYNLDSILKEDGWIRIFDDETDNLIATFTKDNWSKYDSNNYYKYETPVNHIRVETSETNKMSSLYVYNIKELNDKKITEKYSREEFDKLKYISSTLTGYINGNYLNTDTDQAVYESPYSVAEIRLSNGTLSTQAIEKNEVINIKARAGSFYNLSGWYNGSYLIKIPKEILNTEINSVTVSNDNINITSYEVIDGEENQFIKINTSNNSELEQEYEIYIDTNMAPDPRSVTTSKEFELYATNENAVDYYYKSSDIYDVNSNGNTDEIINKTTATINLVSPNSLLTNQTVTNYDDKGSVAISPQIADILPRYGSEAINEAEATIGVQLKNNYSSDISEVKLLGRIPFEGNKYVVSQNDLKSNFSTKMKSNGILVPEELEGRVDVYYSENENATRDLTNVANGWKTKDQVTNWDNIKSYLIDCKDTVISPQKEYIFYYTVSVPNGVQLNKTSYAHHGIFFSLHTEQGKYRTKTEPNKIGIRIASKINLELTKYHLGRDIKVANALYSISEDGENTSRTAATDTDGKLIINGLYTEKTYTIKEIKSPREYELNQNEIKFRTSVNDSTGELTVEKIEGDTKGNFVLVKNPNEDYLLKVELEDEVRGKIKITKKEKNTENRLSNIMYKITGDGLASSGKRITTNSNGEATISGLKIGTEYLIEEVKANGYYLENPVKIRINNDNGNYNAEIIEGTVKNNIVTEDNSIPTLQMELEDEKIPTYNLELTKIKKVNNLTGNDQNNEETVYLQGAKFRLFKDNEKIGDYISDENGRIQINNLYQYVDGKDFDATYVLKEVLPPDGYSKIKDITFKVQEVEGRLEFKEELQEGQSAKTFTSEGNTVKVTAEDNPSFRLTKKDGETDLPLANCKFSIYNMDEKQIPATNSKGMPIGSEEIINGQKYYVVTTDGNGEITADLPEGLYKAVEIEAPEQYDITCKTYYFGIGASREPKTILHKDWIKEGKINVCEIKQTEDGGYIEGGDFYGTIQLGDTTVTSNSDGRQKDAIIIKHNKDGEVEWFHNYSGSLYSDITSISLSNDGGYYASGIVYGTNQFGDTQFAGGEYGVLIKYSPDGNIEWVKKIGKKARSVDVTQDGGCVFLGEFEGTFSEGSIQLVSNGMTDGIVLKYNAEGELIWGNSFGSTDSETTKEIKVCPNGDCIVTGRFYNTIQVGEYQLTSQGQSDGVWIAYSSNGEALWAESIGGSDYEYLDELDVSPDGGFYTILEYSSTLTIKGTQYTASGYRGLLIRFNSNREIEWVKDYSNRDYTMDVTATKDNGCFLAGADSSGLIKKISVDGNEEWRSNIKSTGYSTAIWSINASQDGGFIAAGSTNGTIIDEKDNITGKFIIKYDIKEMPTVSTSYATNIGGQNYDSINSITKTNDGGYILVGDFNNTIQLGDIQLTSNGEKDGLIIKYSSLGVVEWAKSIGGTHNDRLLKVIETSDGGFIVTGYLYGATKVEEAIISNYSSYNGIIIKYSSDGNEEWSHCFDGGNYNCVESVVECQDGGYLTIGSFNAIIQVEDQQVTSGGSDDGLIIKYNSDGSIEWAKNIEGTGNEHFDSIIETSDGNIIASGYYSSDTIIGGTELKINHNDDSIIVKVNNNGEVIWARSINGLNGNYIHDIIPTKEGGAIAVGDIYENGGAVQAGDIQLKGNGNNDGIIVEYDGNGHEKWGKSIGGTMMEYLYTITQTSDGGYIVAGTLESDMHTQTGKLEKKGYQDFFVIKYDENNNEEWAKSIPTYNSGYDTSNTIKDIVETKEAEYLLVGTFYNRITDDNTTITSNGVTDGYIIKLTPIFGAAEQSELEVVNNRKEFKITTDIKEIDGVKGGSITGEDKNPYEKVKYGDNSTKEIKMIPDENYEIIGITVNGEEYPFTANADDTYTMPQFENMTEDKHIVVKYSYKDRKITINKVNVRTREKIPGATFKLDQIEERAEPVNVIGNLTDNGEEYYTANLTNEVTGVLGSINNNGTYYFVEQDVKYVPTNSKTWQIANVDGATGGVSSTTANSYIELDLTEKTGQYAVVINAEVSSEDSYDYGYATITNSTTAPSYSSTTGQFMYISGTQNLKDYTSGLIEGGQKYYIHLGYMKDSSGDSNQDQVIINSVKVYEATSTPTTYNFTNNNGKYESTNEGKDNTTCNSYIPIDLTGKSGKYNVTVNAEISSQVYNDYGYATITESNNRVSYRSYTGRFVYISGTQSAQDFTKELDGGKLYYLHLGYYKNANISTGNDKFIVNSVEVTLSDSEIYHTEVTTNSEGQAITQIPYGKYAVTELSAPNGYYINEAIPDIEFRANGTHEFTIEDEEVSKIIVHHYEAIKNGDGTYTYTKNKLADDEIKEGRMGETYSSDPNMNINKYTLIKDEEGEYVIPNNRTGNFAAEIQEVNYYYEKKPIPLVVHYYIEGTVIPVPLDNGEKAQDVTGSGNVGETYRTSSISGIQDKYELVAIPDNANGTYGENGVVVTYYYREIERKVVILKYDEDGTSPLNGATFEVTNETGTPVEEITTNTQGRAEIRLKSGTYKIKEKNAPDGYETNNTEYSVTINGETEAETEVEVTDRKKRGTVTVHYYEQQADGTPTTIPIKLVNGNNAEDLIKTGVVGDIYATEPHSTPAEYYELVSDTPAYSSGEYIDGNIDVSYYYKLKDYGYTVEYYYDNVKDGSKTESGEATYGSEITTYTDKIIDGYKLQKTENLPLTIGSNPEGNVIKIYYVKRSDLQYTVNYLEKGTNRKVHDPKTEINKTFNDVVISANEVITIYGYNYDSVDKERITIQTDNTKNVINIYYTKKDANVVVRYKDVKTNEEISERTNKPGKVGDQYNTTPKTIEDYTLVEDRLPINGTGRYTEEEIVVEYYYSKNTKVTVKYVDKITGNALTNPITINGHEGDGYETEEKTFTNYTLVEVIGDRSGEMPRNPSEVIYKYVHDSAGVEVNYLDVKTNEPLAGQDTIEGHEGDRYETSPKSYEEGNVDVAKLKDYDLVEDRLPENAEGFMTINKKIVNYYYIKKTNIIVKYKDINSGDDLTTPITIPGHQGDHYETTAKDFTNYVLVETPRNHEGNMGAEPEEVIYYYAHVSAGVIEKHFNEYTGELLASKTYEGNEGDRYRTSSKTFTGYDLNENRLPSNAEGFMTREVQEVDYYYNYKTSVTTRYIDKITNEPLADNITVSGHEGESYETVEKTFEDYDLLEVDGEKNGIMTRNPIVVTYYYVHDSAGVKVNHYDIKSGEKLTIEEHITGHEGDRYETREKEFEGYDLAEERYPTNPNGFLTIEEQEVDYYYIYKTKVTVKYIDKITGLPLTTDIIKNGHEGDRYETEEKTFENYDLLEVYGERNGEMTKAPIVVTYYYVHDSAGVKVNHYDVTSGEKITEEEHITGHEGDRYETREKEFEGYALVEERYPTNPNGFLTIEEQQVDYYYIKKSTVTVKYVDKATGDELTEEIVINGHEGDRYETEEKEFEGYDTDEEEYPEYANGTIPEEPRVVIYYYKKKTKVTSEYIDQETNEKIETDEEINGHEKDSYETLKKEIEYYDLIEMPENYKGEMIAEPITVTYYYKKKPFNIGIDKKVKTVIKNGDERKVNKDVAKQDVKSAESDSTEIKVEYIIVVENKGEIAGTAKIEENIPEGMRMNPEDNPDWTINGDTAVLTTEEIAPGEKKEYIAVLEWEQDEENYGTKENIVKIIETKNKAGFKETDLTDNEDGATFAITVSTGKELTERAMGIALVILIVAGVGIIAIKKRTEDK